MAEAKVTGVVFNATEPSIGTFLNLVTPKRVSASANETPTYSGNFEINPSGKDLGRLRSAIAEAARELFPGINLGQAIKDGEFNIPLSSGDALADKATKKSEMSGKKRDREWSRGKMVLVARSKDDYPPSLSYVENGRMVVLDGVDAKKAAERTHFYSGQRVLYGVRLKAYNAVGATGKPGVKAYLEAVHSCGGGEKLFGGGTDPAERFKDYIGLETDTDPTTASADAW